MSSDHRPERRDRERVRPTRDGWAVLGFTAAALLVGLVTGDNLVLLVACALLSLVIVDVLGGAWNLRGLEVARALPAELFAGWEARGSFRLRNHRRWLSSVAVRIDEVDHPGAGAVALRVDPGGEVHAPVGWRFHERGGGRLTAVRLHSSFPFGLTARERVVELPANLLVYPRPRPGHTEREQDAVGLDAEGCAGVGVEGDFSGIREYRGGDALRKIHWRTSARVGELMVVERAGPSGERLLVRVPDVRGSSWEAELEQACGEVLQGFDRGLAVGLDLAGEVLPPRTGGHWRRVVLDALAEAPVREETR